MVRNFQCQYQKCIDLPSRHLWHSRCVLFVSPQPGHLHKLFTSWRALPFICLCLLRECDTLFFGTARNTDSQMSPSNVGIFKLTPGTAIESVGNSRGVKYRVWNVAQREAEEIVVEENRGSNEAVAAAILGVIGTVRVPTARCEMVFVDGKRGESQSAGICRAQQSRPRRIGVCNDPSLRKCPVGWRWIRS